MHKVWLVIKREYITRVKTKGFILATIGVPLLSAGVMVLSVVMAVRQTGHTMKMAIVDEAGGLGTQIAENLAGEKLDNGKPRFEIAKTLEQPVLEASVRDSLRDQVNGGKLDGYLVIPKDASYVEFHTKNAADFMIYGPVQTAVNHAVITRRLSERGVHIDDVAALMKGINMKVIKVTQQGESEDSGQTFVMGLILAMLLYITLIMYGVITMRSVLEEKTTRIVEVLVSAVRPFQLLLGKIIGVAGVGFTQYLIWITTGLLLVTYGGSVAATVRPGASFPHIHVPASLLAYLGIYFVLGYFLYASLYASVGAASSNEQDAQQLQLVVTLPLVFGFIMYNGVLRDPSSTLSFVLSEIPLFSPILMVLRITAQTPPFWQIALSIFILAVTMLGVVYLSSRIYRVGILMYGKRPSLVEILRWLRYS
jgi:ABC-2 type transport system permease protein